MDSELVENPVSLRAERSGIGSILTSLRGNNLASEISHLSTESHNESEDSEIDQIPMNRKQKRALLRAQEQKMERTVEKVEKAEKAAKLEKKVPTGLELKLCDVESFSQYEASFGYKTSRDNNYVHFSVQNSAGTHTITGSQDRMLRMYKRNETVDKIWTHNMGGLILDVFWRKNGSEVFSTAKGRPIQMWDAENGRIAGTFSGKDSGDSVKEAMSIAEVNGALIGGFKNHFQVWDVNFTGNSIDRIKYLDQNYNTGTSGICMSICPHPTMPDLFSAAGTSSRVAIYSAQWKSAVSTIEGSEKGYTDLKFSADGLKLYASERSGDIHCFDTRMNMLTQILRREMTTSHRVRIDVDPESGRFLFSGSSSGKVLMYDLHDYTEHLAPFLEVAVSPSCVPCVSVCNSKLVLCTGQRSFYDPENEEQPQPISENSIKFFEISE